MHWIIEHMDLYIIKEYFREFYIWAHFKSEKSDTTCE